MPHSERKQKIQLAAASAGALAFIALMVVLTLSLSGGTAHPTSTGSATSPYSPSGVLPTPNSPGNRQIIPNSGTGVALAFTLPSGAHAFTSTTSANNPEIAGFTVGGTRVQVSASAAVVGVDLSALAAAYGSAAKPIKLASGPAYVIESTSGGVTAVTFMRYDDGSIVTVETLGTGDTVSAAEKLNSALNIGPAANTAKS